MKKLLVVFLILGGVLFAQEETLLGYRNITHGGFGGPVVKFTKVKGEFATLVGGRGGWIINHSFIIGGGGYGLVNNIRGNKVFLEDANADNPFGRTRRILMGYGGLELEYIYKPYKLLHVSLYTMIGGGGVTQRDTDKDYDDDFIDDEDTDPFFIFSPEANVTLNVTRFFRISVNAGYRFTNGVDQHDLDDTDFSGFTGGLTFRFGQF